MNNFHVSVFFSSFHKQIETKAIHAVCQCMKRMDGNCSANMQRMRSIFLFYELNFYAFYLMSIISQSNKYNIF